LDCFCDKKLYHLHDVKRLFKIQNYLNYGVLWESASGSKYSDKNIVLIANYEEEKSNRNKEKACQMLASGQDLQGGDYEKAMGVAKIILAPTGKDLSAIAQNCREHIKAEVSEDQRRKRLNLLPCDRKFRKRDGEQHGRPLKLIARRSVEEAAFFDERSIESVLGIQLDRDDIRWFHIFREGCETQHFTQAQIGFNVPRHKGK
jgi:hypothetical protein